MMEYEAKQLFKAGKKNKQFLDDIFMADKDTKPNRFSSEMRKAIFTAAYYGWLVGKYGNSWRIMI